MRKIIFTLCVLPLLYGCSRLNGYGYMQIINNSDYHLAVVTPHLGDDGTWVNDSKYANDEPLNYTFAVAPHSTRRVGDWFLKRHFEDLFEDGPIVFTILDSVVVKNNSSMDVVNNRMFLAQYEITLERLHYYMLNDNLLSITYPSYDGRP